MRPDQVTRLAAAGIHRFPQGWSWSFKENPLPWRGYVLGSVLEGRAAVQREDCPDSPASDAPRATCYWLPLESPVHRLRNLGPGSLTLAWFHLETTASAPPPPLIARPSCFSFWEHLVHRVVEDFQQARPDSARSWLDVALLELARRPGNTAEIADETDSAHASKIEALCRRLRQSPGEDWTVARMAATVHLGPAQFTKVFARQIGRPPRRYLLDLRIEAGRSYLESTAYPLARLAELLGYSDAFAFSRQFKRETGVSPDLHRRQSRRINRLSVPSARAA